MREGQNTSLHLEKGKVNLSNREKPPLASPFSHPSRPLYQYCRSVFSVEFGPASLGKDCPIPTQIQRFPRLPAESQFTSDQ